MTYTAVPSDKLHNLIQFTIYIDLTTSSTGLSAFEKIISYAINQKEMNFIVGQWKDGAVLHLPDYKRQKEIHFGAEGVLKKEVRAKLLISYNGTRLFLYQDGRVEKYRETGPLPFKNWSKDYPLVIGTDANGRSQWQGQINEIAMFDRALSSDEVMRLSGLSSPSSLSRQEKGEGGGVSRGGGILRQAQDDKPLIHYVFRPENTYETTFRGGKALGVRDLGKGEAADLVIPEYFMPYKRAYLEWDNDWMQYKANWIDAAINIIGFLPFGFLLLMQLVKYHVAGDRLPVTGNREDEKSGGGKPMSSRKAVVAVIMTVVAGFVVSFAIEYLQAYLPSRDSSMRDLICNTLGTAIGALAAAWLYCSQLATVKRSA